MSKHQDEWEPKTIQNEWGTRMQHNHYIRMYDTFYEVVGPFDTEEALARSGRAWQKRNGDNPCWQSIYLAPGATAPRKVIKPTQRQRKKV